MKITRTKADYLKSIIDDNHNFDYNEKEMLKEAVERCVPYKPTDKYVCDLRLERLEYGRIQTQI